MLQVSYCAKKSHGSDDPHRCLLLNVIHEAMGLLLLGVACTIKLCTGIIVHILFLVVLIDGETGETCFASGRQKWSSIPTLSIPRYLSDADINRDVLDTSIKISVKMKSCKIHGKSAKLLQC